MDSPTTFSADASQKAIEMLDQLENTAANAATVPEVDTTPAQVPTVQAPIVQSQQPEQPVAPQPLDVSDDTPIRIKVNGEEKIVTAKEYTEILQRTDVWTQRLQALAQQRKEYEENAAQREAQIIEAARAVQLARQELAAQQPNLIQQLQQLAAQNQEQQRQNPNEIATLGEVQQQIQALIGQIQQQQQTERQQLAEQFNAQIEQAKIQAQIERDKAVFTSEISKLMSSEDGKLFSELVPHAEAAIRYNTMQLQPKDVNEAIDFARKVFEDQVGKIKGRFAQQTTKTEVAKAKVVLEPPQGSAPALQTSQPKIAFNKDGSVNWEALRNKAMTYLQD